MEALPQDYSASSFALQPRILKSNNSPDTDSQSLKPLNPTDQVTCAREPDAHEAKRSNFRNDYEKQ